MKYTLNPNVVLVTVLDESMLVTVGSHNSIDEMRSINKTGAYYWTQLENGVETDDIIARSVQEYGITRERAKSSFMEFLFALRDAGYVVVED